MNVKQAAQSVKQGRLAPVYVCVGTEVHLMQKFVDSVIEQASLPEHREFAVTKFDLNETPIEVVIEDVETLPFMVPKKIVVASNATFLTGKDKTKVEHHLDKLLDYILAPVDYSILILLVTEEKLDERKKIVKALKKNNQLISFQPLNANELDQWVKSLAAEKGCPISDEAIRTLISYTGSQLQAIEAELEKCALFAGGEMITAEIVEQLVSRSLEQSVFKLIDEIVEMKVDRALSTLHELIKLREEPVKILMLIARQFRIILQVGELNRRGLSQQQIGAQLKIHPFVAKLALPHTRRFDADACSKILADIAELDYKMKSGTIDKVLGLEMLLLGISGKQKASNIY